MGLHVLTTYLFQYFIVIQNLLIYNINFNSEYSIVFITRRIPRSDHMIGGIYGWAEAQGALDRSSAALNSGNESGSQTTNIIIVSLHGNEKENVQYIRGN